MSRNTLVLLAGPMMALSLGSGAFAQNSGQDALSQLLGAVLGQVNSMDAQWQRGQRPLAAGRAEFASKLDTDIRAGSLSSVAGARLRADYDDLVTLEARYAADGSFSTQERSDLRSRYDALSRTYSEGGPAVGGGPTAAAGQAAFEARVEAAVNARRLTRTQATTLRSDYAAVVQLENTYARDGISVRERVDLDSRLDALDRRLPDLPPPPVQLTVRARLDQLQNAISVSQRSRVLTASQAAELRVQLGDLSRLETAYTRFRPSAEESAYLERRVGELEARTRSGARAGGR